MKWNHLLAYNQELIKDHCLLTHISYGHEACGVIMEDRNGKYLVFPVPNIQNDFIEKCPIPMNATNSYVMEANYIYRIMYLLKNSNKYNLSGIYHSHCDYEKLEFSSTDIYFALKNKDTPWFPEINYFLLGIQNNKINLIHNYFWDKNINKYTNVQEINLFL